MARGIATRDEVAAAGAESGVEDPPAACGVDAVAMARGPMRDEVDAVSEGAARAAGATRAGPCRLGLGLRVGLDGSSGAIARSGAAVEGSCGTGDSGSRAARTAAGFLTC